MGVKIFKRLNLWNRGKLDLIGCKNSQGLTKLYKKTSKLVTLVITGGLR